MYIYRKHAGYIQTSSTEREINMWTDRRSRNTVSLISLSSGLVRTALAYHATLLSHDLSHEEVDLTSFRLLFSLHCQQRTDCAQVRLIYQAELFIGTGY